MKLVIANNIGEYSLLYDVDIVYNQFLPIFFKYCFDPVAKVSETSSMGFPLIIQALEIDWNK
jgi:hypothetical protein